MINETRDKRPQFISLEFKSATAESGVLKHLKGSHNHAHEKKNIHLKDRAMQLVPTDVTKLMVENYVKGAKDPKDKVLGFLKMATGCDLSSLNEEELKETAKFLLESADIELTAAIIGSKKHNTNLVKEFKLFAEHPALSRGTNRLSLENLKIILGLEKRDEILQLFISNPSLRKLDQEVIKGILTSKNAINVMREVMREPNLWKHHTSIDILKLIVNSKNAIHLIKEISILLKTHTRANMEILRQAFFTKDPLATISALNLWKDHHEVDPDVLKQILFSDKRLEIIAILSKYPKLYHQGPDQLDPSALKKILELGDDDRLVFLDSLGKNSLRTSYKINPILISAALSSKDNPIQSLFRISGMPELWEGRDNEQIDALGRFIADAKDLSALTGTGRLEYRSGQISSESNTRIFNKITEEMDDPQISNPAPDSDGTSLGVSAVFFADLDRTNMYIRDNGQLIQFNDKNDPQDPFPTAIDAVDQKNLPNRELQWKKRRIAELREFCGYVEGGDEGRNELADQKLFKLSQVMGQTASNRLNWGMGEDPKSPLKLSNGDVIIIQTGVSARHIVEKQEDGNINYELQVAGGGMDTVLMLEASKDGRKAGNVLEKSVVKSNSRLNIDFKMTLVDGREWQEQEGSVDYLFEVKKNT